MKQMFTANMCEFDSPKCALYAYQISTKTPNHEKIEI